METRPSPLPSFARQAVRAEGTQAGRAPTLQGRGRAAGLGPDDDVRVTLEDCCSCSQQRVKLGQWSSQLTARALGLVLFRRGAFHNTAN